MVRGNLSSTMDPYLFKNNNQSNSNPVAAETADFRWILYSKQLYFGVENFIAEVCVFSQRTTPTIFIVLAAVINLQGKENSVSFQLSVIISNMQNTTASRILNRRNLLVIILFAFYDNYY